MFGMIPAYGFFIRHASGIQVSDFSVGFVQEDRRPAFVLDVTGISFSRVAKKAANVPSFVLMDLSIDHCLGSADVRAARINRKEM